MEEKALIDLIVHTLDEHKATDILTADVSRLTPFATHYVLATCPNVRALGAFVDALEEECGKQGVTARASDGEPDSGWIVIDFDGIIVHLFLDWARREVKLDELVNRRKDDIKAHEA